MRVNYFEKRGTIWLDFRSTDGRRHRVPSGTADRREAERLAPSLIARAEAASSVLKRPAQATLPKVGGMTIVEAYRKAEKTREQWIKSKDKTTRVITFNNLGLPDDTPVAMLTRDFVRDLRTKWMQEEGKIKGSKLSPSTINARLSMLSVLLSAADLPPHGVKFLSVKGNRRMRRISDDEVAKIKEWLAAHSSRLGATSMIALIDLALETGARLGELLDLTWADVGKDTLTFRDTKNHESRTIPLTKAGSALLSPRRGLPAPFSDLSKRRAEALWSDARAAMGLATDREFVFHALRHETLSRLADKGANAFVLATIAGHSNVTTTQRYVKTSLAAMREVMQ